MALSQWTELANHYGARFSVPPGLILSLIDMESGGDKDEVHLRSHATGLMQITLTVLKGYNERHNLSLTMQDLKDPELNVRMGAELLKRISMMYEKHNNLTPNWGNRTYVGLIIFGWNAGYSAKQGVSFVLSKLQSAGVPKNRWNLDMVYDAALKIPYAFRKLKEISPDELPRRFAWSKKVNGRFFGIEKNARKRVAKASDGEKKEWSTGKKAIVYGSVGAGLLTAGYFILSKSDVEQSATGLLAAQSSGPPIIIINRK